LFNLSCAVFRLSFVVCFTLSNIRYLYKEFCVVFYPSCAVFCSSLSLSWEWLCAACCVCMRFLP
jgi:hypothetical protein